MVIITQSVNEVVLSLCNCKHKVVGIIESAPRNRKTIKFRIIRFMHYFQRENKSLYKFATNNHIPYYYFTGQDNSLENWIRSLEPDIIVIRSMSQLLSERIFQIPPHGTINLHGSLLPKYRGPNPTFWTYYHMDLHPGMTVHYIDRGEDTGDIIYQESFDVVMGITLQEYLKLQMKLGSRLVMEALDSIEEGTAPRHVQHDSPTPRARNVSDGEHESLIDWNNWPIERIWHVLRGTSTWLNALDSPKGMWYGQRWSVLDFEKCKTTGYQNGEIYREDKQIFVICTEGKIYLSVKFSFRNLAETLISHLDKFYKNISQQSSKQAGNL